MFLVDTNILVYALDSDFEEHKRCRTFLEGCITDSIPWYITWTIIYEFLRITTHPRVFRSPLSIDQAWSFINNMLTSQSIRILSEGQNHSQIAYKTFHEIKGIRGNLLHDAHTAILMREHGIRRIYTRDMDFNRFHFLEVIDPINM